MGGGGGGGEGSTYTCVHAYIHTSMYIRYIRIYIYIFHIYYIHVEDMAAPPLGNFY